MRIFGSWRAKHVAGLVGVLVVGALALGASVAQAETSAPGWYDNTSVYPSHLAPGGKGYIILEIYNVGGAASSGPVTVTDTLPSGVTATEAGYTGADFATEGEIGITHYGKQWECSLGNVVTCTSDSEGLPTVPPGEMEFLAIAVTAPGNASGTGVNKVAVTGGGALTPANTTSPVDFGTTPAKFGFQRVDSWFSNANGTLDTQAGSHPYTLTVSFTLENNGRLPANEARNINVNLPPGLVGNPTSIPRCTTAQLNSQKCPPDTQVGFDRASLEGPSEFDYPENETPTIEELGQNLEFAPQFPVYNMVPPPGVPAQFAFDFNGLATRLNAKVRSGSDYGITESIDNILQTQLSFNTITIWGVPGDLTHDYQRCAQLEGSVYAEHCGISSGIKHVPLLTLPTACEGPQTFSATAEPWLPEPGIAPAEYSFQTHENSGTPAGITGCDHLSFDTSLSVAPDTTESESPAGYTVEVKAPQDGLTSLEGLSTSNIKNTTVTLPEGVAINPGQAHGLAMCAMAQSAIGTESEPTCPNASKVGTDQIETPLLTGKLEGNVYLLESSPPNLKLLVAASGEGVNLKLIGEVHLDESTGRLTTTFKETPELPFTVFKLTFSGGPQAALTTPPTCGSYRTTSDFTPWSTPGISDAFPGSEFVIDSGPNGSSCAAQPFAPELTAGSTTDQAGGYTDFTMLLTRQDGQPRISTLQFKTPKGLLGMISKVPLCGEPQAADGDCPAASQIGHTTVEAGPGSAPLVIPEPGQPAAPIYLTGGYKGAPYGLSIVVPVIAGPFNLGTVVVRASIAVDPTTAQLTITTDPLPSILDGVPTDLRAINAVIDKPEFMFNPTNCEPQAFSGTATSLEGATAAISSHFQMGSCRSLAFKPDFKASTSSTTSRNDGASLDAKIEYPNINPGANQASSQANIASVKVDLPIQMPSRLTTLQKACLAKVFEEDPAKCPKESLVGSATAVTPVLPVPLTGPAYFVSHGGEAFPSLIVVLQGYGVTVDLVGTTFIKDGITSSTFKQVPDVPVTSFDLKLPQGPFSALGANLPASAKGSFCGQNLQMPTLFTGQNGAVIKQSTPIAVEGCSSKLSVKHTRKGKALTLTIYAPDAGKITISGKGIATSTRVVKGQQNVTVKLKVKSSKAKLKVGFEPTKGSRQGLTVTA